MPWNATEDKIGQRIDASPALSRLARYGVDIILAVFAAFAISRSDYRLRFWIGITIAVVGTFLWALARIQLGSSFSVGPQARRLVTTGLPFRRLQVAPRSHMGPTISRRLRP